jgi:hypothetical protein
MNVNRYTSVNGSLQVPVAELLAGLKGMTAPAPGPRTLTNKPATIVKGGNVAS